MTYTWNGSINLTDRYLMALLRRRSIPALPLSRRDRLRFMLVERLCDGVVVSCGTYRSDIDRDPAWHSSVAKIVAIVVVAIEQRKKVNKLSILSMTAGIDSIPMSKSIQRVKRIINFRAHQIGSTLVMLDALVNYNVREEAAIERNGPI